MVRRYISVVSIRSLTGPFCRIGGGQPLSRPGRVGRVPTTTVMWFRRDLRLADNPALLDACDSDGVLPLFVLDPALWNPVREVVHAARQVGASRVHVAADYGPYGHQRDHDVEQALADAGIELVRTGSPYAVAPDRVRNGSGNPYKVFTPFSRGWMEHGWRDPVDAPAAATWLALDDTVDLPSPELPDGLDLPEAGEDAARRRWQAYVEGPLADYDGDRDRPDLDATSHMSAHLKWGEIHPRTM